MNTKIIVLMMALLMCISSVIGISGTTTAVWTYSEGNWSTTNPGNQTADGNKSTYGECNDDTCLVTMNFTMPGMGYYDSVVWISNVSNNTQINNGEDVWAQSDCWTWSSNNMLEGMVMINNSANPNITYWCSIASDTWIEVGTYAAKKGIVWYNELYWTDAQSTVDLDLTLNGSSKVCASGTPETVDLVFTVTDNTDTEFNCCPIVDSVNLTSFCNSSIQNNTESVIYNVPLDSGRLNEVMVECADERSAAWSDTLYLDVEQCEDCDSLLEGWAKFAIIALIISIMVAGALGKDFLTKNKWVFGLMFLLIAGIFAIIVLNNMINPCGI